MTVSRGAKSLVVSATFILAACANRTTPTVTAPLSLPTVTAVPQASQTYTPNPTDTPVVASSATPVPQSTVAPTGTPTATVAQSAPPCPAADAQWRQANSLSHMEIYNGYASADGCEVWIAGHQVGDQAQAVVLHSVDGGQTLEVVATPEALMLWQIGFSDSTSGWVVGDAAEPNQPGVVLHSTDGGLTWSLVSIPSESTSYSYLAFSNDTVWIGGNSNGHVTIVSSPDSGATWVPAPLADAPITNLEAIAALGNTVVLVGTNENQGVIAISHDNGQSFIYQAGAGGMTTALTADLLDENKIYIGGYAAPGGIVENASAILLLTEDGGATWQTIAVPNGTIRISDLYFATSDFGYSLINGIQRVTVAPDGALAWGEPEPLNPAPAFGGMNHLFGSTDATIFAIGLGGLYRSKP